MKTYSTPEMVKITIQSGVSFAAYTCQPDITYVKNADGVCVAQGGLTPILDKGAEYEWYCYTTKDD